MNATVRKWGNSLALRIPRSLAQDVDLRQGSVVELHVVEGEMRVKPKRQSKPSLADMLKAITRHNLHAEVGWGKTRGKEAW